MAGELEGTIEKELPRGLYAVRCDDGRRVVATLSPEARRVTARVRDGDRVVIEISTFDPGRARIKGRLS